MNFNNVGLVELTRKDTLVGERMQWVGHVLCLDIVPCLDELIYINLFYLWEKLRYSSLTLGS